MSLVIQRSAIGSGYSSPHKLRNDGGRILALHKSDQREPLKPGRILSLQKMLLRSPGIKIPKQCASECPPVKTGPMEILPQQSESGWNGKKSKGENAEFKGAYQMAKSGKNIQAELAQLKAQLRGYKSRLRNLEKIIAKAKRSK